MQYKIQNSIKLMVQPEFSPVYRPLSPHPHPPPSPLPPPFHLIASVECRLLNLKII